MRALRVVIADDEHAIRAFDLGADDYLLKPHDESRVAAAVARVRRRSRRGRRGSWP